MHKFRKERNRAGKLAFKVIHPTSNIEHGSAWLFKPYPNWDPEDPASRERTCPECLRLLEFEKLEEQRKENQKAKV